MNFVKLVIYIYAITEI